MTAIQIQLPDAVAKTVQRLAERSGISVEELVANALTEKLYNWNHESFQERMARASEDKFRKSLEQVPDVEPDENDRL